MTGKALAFIAAGVLLVIVVCSGLAGALMGGAGGGALCAPVPVSPSGSPSPSASPAGATPTLAPTGGVWPAFGPWSSEQVTNAATIVSVGVRMQVPTRGWVIALATSMQESRLRNLGHLGPANDHDSLGLFQQRPSTGWGTPAQIMDPAYASGKFYDKLLKVEGWQSLPLTVAAQKVQISAFPEAYAQHEAAAAELVTALTGLSGALGACGGAVGPQGWIAPVGDPVTSGFHTAERPSHDGVDLGSPKNTPIRAAAEGMVVVAECNAHLGGRPYSCDVDGSPAVSGCGYYVDIDHGAGIRTRYCHMLTRPAVAVGQKVTAGQVIGVTGTSGNSSGPHLHYEVRVSGQPVEPIAWHAAHGAPLRP
ncbi:M23 family metallopeptidase [Longispora albida]|uniref:M23 family metallopeptidase n=1 Tax=Longispora albida TaxID=203523 RepID=UPI00037E7944|nr:M23 family metallopeptidase [Longispora albida]